MNSCITKILVYIDGSEESYSASLYGIALARSLDAELYGVYVINTRALNDLVKSHIFVVDEEEQYRRDLEKDAERYLKLFTDMAEAKGVTPVCWKKSGAVHQLVKEITDEQAIDVLIIGELSRIRSRRDETYNDADRTMRYVSCPVMIAKGEDRIQQLYDRL